MHKMKKIKEVFVSFLLENVGFLIFLVLLYIVLTFPVNYYIIIGGEISNVSSRIKVEDSYQSKGSFNISYVKELQGTVMSYLLSNIIPSWDRKDMNNYKYDDSESIEDVKFRNNLDLKACNGYATYWAYTLANKEVSLKSSNLYIISAISNKNSPLQVGDILLSIDGKHYETIDEYTDCIRSHKKDDILLVKVLRNQKEMELEVPLYEYGDTVYMGVILQYEKEYDTNPNVDITFERGISGPSGGLITTLEIYNQLTKKDLTHGLKIAGTGTIEEDGRIGMIGGVKYKLLGAEAGGADVFLVPSGDNYQEALKYKKKKHLKIKIIEVTNIEDAIQKVEKLKG